MTIDTALSSKLEASKSTAQQAANIWYFTGMTTSSLSVLDSWGAELMQDLYSSSKLSALRFGTIGGLEEGFNGTANGVRVLRRDSQNACLKTYLADGSTSDSTAYPDDCNYDPRYTDWYKAGRDLVGVSGFSNTYDNLW